MSRHVDTGSTDQTIVFWAFDSSGAAVEVTTSDSVSYRVDSNGREGTAVSMTLVSRTVAGTHRDNAITYKGDGKHEIDLPDAAVSSAGEVTLEVTKSGVASVYVEKLEVSTAGAASTQIAEIKVKTNNLPTDPADQSAVEAAITAAASLLATAAELAKVPKVGSTHRYTQVASDSNLKTADVSIGAVT